MSGLHGLSPPVIFTKTSGIKLKIYISLQIYIILLLKTTLIAFHRWIKCLATSLAALPWTKTPMSCQGILGVVDRSTKSVEIY